MGIINKLFGKKENPHLVILKQVLPKEIDLSKSVIYHIKSFEFTNLNMDLFDKNMGDKNFYSVLDKLDYNSQSDNVGLYYVINPQNQNYIYLVSDPLELYEKEYIVKKYNGTLDEHVMGLHTVEKIN